MFEACLSYIFLYKKESMSRPILNIVFPMAGDGIRFGGVFKPLHTIGESYFIELVKYRFDILRSQFNLKFF